MTTPSALSTLSLFGRVAIRRGLNRIFAFQFKKAPGKQSTEGATPRGASRHRAEKRSFTWRALGALLPISSMLGLVLLVSQSMFAILDSVLLSEIRSASVLRLSTDDLISLQKAAAIGDTQQRKTAVETALRSAFETPAAWLTNECVTVATRRFEQSGLAAFAPVNTSTPYLGTMAYLSPSGRQMAQRAMGAFLALLAGCLALIGVGINGKAMLGFDPELSWLWQFPVSRRVLFTSKIVEYTIDTPLALLVAPLYATVLWLGGASFLVGAGFGLLAGVAVATLIGALRLVSEVLLTQRVGRAKRGTIVGVLATVGLFSLLGLMFGTQTQIVTRALSGPAATLPQWIYLNPLSSAIGFVGPGQASALLWLIGPLSAVVMAVIAVELSVRLSRSGLAEQTDTARSSSAPARASAWSNLGALAWKESLLLKRHPELLIQLVMTPLVLTFLIYVGGYQRALNLAAQGAANSTIAIFLIGMYSVFVMVQQLLTSELKNLWLLQCQPRPLAEVIRSKSRLWATALLLTSVPFLIAVVAYFPHEWLEVATRLPFLMAALWLQTQLVFAFAAVNASITSEGKVKFRNTAMLIPGLIACNAAVALYANSWWSQLSIVAMLLVLDRAMFDRQVVELPWLSEPEVHPPKQITALQPIVALIGFQTCVSAGGAALTSAGWLSPAASWATGYAASAAVVALLLWRWLRSAGLPLVIAGVRHAATRPVLYGLAVTSATAVVVRQLEIWLGGAGLQNPLERLLADRSTIDFWSVVAVIVVVAPIFEEWLFRGLLYRSLRQHWSRWVSVGATAVLFATLHPLQSGVALLTLGVATALVAERTGRLWPSIVVHAGYNAVVLTLWMT